MTQEKEPDTAATRRFSAENLEAITKRLLSSLTELQNQTDPANSNAEGKDRAALSALFNAGMLVEAVAGWAIDHVIGLALEERELLPLQPSGALSHPEYLEIKQANDDHRHELAGAAISDSFDNIDPKIARSLLISLATGNPGGFPSSLQRQIIESLQALQFGEVLPLVAPQQRKGPSPLYRELRAQLRAVEFVAFRKGLGVKKYVAIGEICSAFGIGEEGYRSWEKRLRQDLGNLEVARAISFASNAAANVQEARRTQDKLMLSAGAPYSDEALRRAVQEYHDAQRT